MLEKRWKAIFKAILIIIPYMALVFFYAAFESASSSARMPEFMSMVIIGLPSYLAFSLICWLFIGSLIHQLIEKYADGRWLWYLVSAITTCILVVFLPSSQQYFYLLLFGIPIVLQVTLFKYYFDKNKN